MDIKLLHILLSIFLNPFLIWTIHASPNPYKLPESLVPLNYFLQIRPIFHESHNESFSGQNGTAPAFIKITVSCVSPTKTIVLHQKFLEINESSIQIKRVYSNSPKENELNATIDKRESSDTPDNISLITSGDTVVNYDEEKDFMSFNSTSTLTPGNIYEISMSFTAKIPKGGSIDGLYSVKYKPPFAPNTGLRVMAVTSFEPVGARQVFPCFDEPIYKATWDIVIGKMKDFTVLSNGPLISTQPDEDNPDWLWDRFGTTVKLPTYLVAFAVLSDFGFAEAPSSLFRLPVRVYGPKEWVSSAPHAQLLANFSAQLLSFYEDHFGVPFDMPKLDSLWIAKKREATECHGLILYGEQILIAEPDGATDLGSIRFHLNLISHEIAHSWFGNMVGSSWTEVWLKEGMATLASPWGLDAVKPEVGSGTDHIIYEAITTALHYDGGEQSRPLRKEALRKDEIDLNMDTLGYDKGSALGRMMKGVLGEEGFHEGLRAYLRRFRGSVATQDDLFRELGRVGGEVIGDRDLGEVMRPWTEQKGYPLIRVRVQEGGSGIVVSQEAWEHWEGKEERGEGENETVSWDIPIKYQLIKSLRVEEGWFWLSKGQMEREVNFTEELRDEDDDWVFLGNSDSAGYYRVMYEDNLAKRIVAQLNKNHSVFGASARARLLDDQLNLAFQRYIPIQNALEFTRYLENERDPTVWNCVLQPFLQVSMLFRPTLIGLETEDDFIHLRDTIHFKLIEEFEDAFRNSSFNNTDTLLTNPVNFSKLIEILYVEISKLRASNGVNNESFKSFRNYMLPRINATLVDITTGSHPPGSKNFSLSAEGLLETVLVDWSCSFNSEWCLQYSFALTKEWAWSATNTTFAKNPIPSDIQTKLYCQIVDWFGVPTFEWIYSQFEASSDPIQQILLSSALGCSPPDDMSFHSLLSILTSYDKTNSSSLSKMDKSFVSTIYEKMMQHSEFGTIFLALLLSFLEPSEYQTYLRLEDVNVAKDFFGYLQNFLWTGFHLQLVEHLVAGNPEYYEESLNGTIDAIIDNAFWMETFRENITLWMKNASNPF